MPNLTRIFQLLPIAVVLWMMFGAAMIFTRDAGRRDPRGLGIAASMWATFAARGLANPAPLWLQWVGVVGLLLALALYQWAALSIRGRTFSYAGNDDLPQFVHSSGPYAYIRNPFYLSYLLAEIFTIVMWPTVWGVGVVIVAAIYFQWLARFEEGKFSRSAVAAEYAEYKARTGRLVPRF